jgi:LmbE family N-acetylglucosaminyl deacetylase
MSELSDIRYALPDVKRALVFSPHPDDETIGCGGTMALYADRIDFTVVTLSKGEAINIPEENKGDLRKKELVKAMQVVGVKDIIFLDMPDGKFEENSDEIGKKISEICRRKDPEIIFVPSPLDPHPDHRQTAKAVIEYTQSSPSLRIAFYEVYTPIRFNTLIDIGRKLETKREALSQYHYSMLKRKDIFISAILSLNRFRSLFTLEESYYEAFFIADKPPTLGGLSRWMAFNSRPESPEEELLDTLRMGDALLKELRDCERNASFLQERTLAMQKSIDEKSLLLSSLEKKMTSLEKNLFWKIAKYLYKNR